MTGWPSFRIGLGAVIIAVGCVTAGAQEQAEPQSIPFAGGAFTITETPDYDKILAYDGQEIARNFMVFHDRMVTVGETDVALFSVGDGGNQCGPATVIAWKGEDGKLLTDTVGEDCGAPPASVASDRLYFVPFPIPGSSSPLEEWSPATGVRRSGMLQFQPQPDTSWADFDAAALDNIVNAFDNQDVYRAAEGLLGRRLGDFVTGLLTGGAIERTVNGTVYASGCVPHACGSADAFMAVDPKGRRLFLAQMGDKPEPDAWPPLQRWPADMRSAMLAAIGPQR